MTINLIGTGINALQYNGGTYTDGDSFTLIQGTSSAQFTGNPAVTCDDLTIELTVTNNIGLAPQSATQSFFYNGGGEPCD